MRTVNETLNPSSRSKRGQALEDALRHRVVGQDEAIEKVVEIYETFLAGFQAPGRPVGNLLLLGPTGTGKTRLVEALAESLFGDSRAVLKIDCAEFQHAHEIAKLIGSPPGYLGHNETHALLTQERLNQHHREDLKLSIVLFDEIEKASDALWNLLLGITDKATLTLGTNRRVDFSQTLIVMTSNVGAADMAALLGENTRGFTPSSVTAQHSAKLTDVALSAARRKFSPEFINRIDKMVVFNTLGEEHLNKVLDIELGRVQQRILQATGCNQFVFTCSPEAKKVLLLQGIDKRYGARHLKRVLEVNLVHPLATLVSTGQIKLGDYIRVDHNGHKFTFTKEAEEALVPALLEKYNELFNAHASTGTGQN